jgi:outer membrane protein assembly factor BamE
MSIFLLGGCAIYRLNIPQGNEVTQDQVAKLKPGQTQAQVQHLLGSPLLKDPFHTHRWDYIYTIAKGGKLLVEKKFTVFFEKGLLVRWEGEVLPASERARQRLLSEAGQLEASEVAAQ